MPDQEIPLNIWQVSGGPKNRSYSDVFLRFGVGLIGSGDPGPWRPDRPDKEFGGSYVRRFATLPQIGDVILLRTGVSVVKAIGLVASPYQYLPQFDDVNGWDLQHALRIRWSVLPEEYNFGVSVFGSYPSRFSRVNHLGVEDYAKRYVKSPPTRWQTADLPTLPQEEPFIECVPDFLQGLVAQVQDLSSLYWDRRRFGEHPGEDEFVAHYVVPFLRALNWPVECIAVKWRHIDVCVFQSLPRTAENSVFIIEAKRMGQGIEGALAQAKRYLKEIGVSRDVVVTDGIRYRMYDALHGFIPIAYANLTYLKSSALRLFERMKRS
ncbi:MAG: hypothetical protein LAO31_11790 [Acidobacteriia bacterium]|nr:hypothetical protein [Terriglobia bacterium]